MSQINLKSITGITSITTPAGVDNVFTVHTNDTTERFRVDSNGNQVIAGILTVSQNLTATSLTIDDYIYHQGDTNTFIGFESNDTIRFNTNGSDKLKINSSGHLILADDNNTYIHHPAADSLAVTTNAAERLRINSTGDIGINFSGTPAATLDIRTDRDPANGLMCFLRNNAQNGNGAFYGVDTNSVGAFSFGIPDNTNAFVIVDGLGNSGTERLRIANTGQVIIGDDDIDKANGNFDDLIVGANASSTETHGITIVCGNAATNGGIAFSDGSAGGADAYRGMISYHHADNHMQFRTNAVERLRIESGGDVDIKGGVLKLGSGANRRLMYRSGNNDVILEADSGDFYRQDIANSTHEFFTGNNERLRITSSGEMGVNTTAPVEKLGISGNMRFVNPNGTTSRITALPSGTYSTGTSGGSAVCFQRIADGAGGSDEIFFETHWQGNRHGESCRINKYGNLKFPSGQGIDFSSQTNEGSTSQNALLADYEEGVWTPTNTIGMTLTNNNTAHYIKIGKQVTVWFDLTLTGNPDSAQCSMIQNLPYVSKQSNTYYGQSNSVWYSNTGDAKKDYDDDNTLIFVNNNDTNIYIWNVTSGHSRVRSWGNNRRFRGTITYLAKN